MEVANNYFEAAYPEPYQILGVRLRPFSLGHYIKLSRLGCAFVSETEQNAKLSDLLLGIVVCSMPTSADQEKDEFWKWLSRRNGGIRYRFYKAFKQLFRMPYSTPAEYDFFMWGKKMGLIDFKAKVGMFSEYMAKHSAIPAYVEEKRDAPPRPSGSHWVHSVLVSLVSNCGYTMEDALNAPISRALSDFIKKAESDGAVRIIPSEALV